MSASSSSASASSAASAAAATGKKRRREDAKTFNAEEIPTSALSLLTRSLVLHTGVDLAVHEALADAMATLPFAEEVVHLLGPVALAAECNPPFFLGGPASPHTLWLAALHPALRELSVRDEVKAWVAVDFLCLPAAARMLEDDLTQRYIQNPGGEADWRAAFTVDGCPACDTLWELVTKKYAALLPRWDAQDAMPPSSFGAQLAAEQPGVRATRQRAACVALLDAITAKQLGAMGAPYAPMLTAALSHPDLIVARAAFAALESLEGGQHYVEGYSVALSRFVDDGVVVRRICSTMSKWSIETIAAQQSVLIAHAVPALIRALSTNRDDANMVYSLCNSISTLGRCDGIAAAFAASGLLPVLIDLLPRLDSNVKMFNSIMTATRNTTWNGNNVAAFVAAGGLAPTFNAFRKHSGNIRVAENILGAISSWSRTSDVNRAVIAAEGGVQLVVDALKQHAANLVVIKNGVQCTRFLLLSPTTGAKFVAAGIIPILVGTLGPRYFPHESGAICAASSWALNNLAEDPKCRASIAASAEVVPSLIRVLSTLIDNTVAVRGACWALSELAELDSCRSTITAAGGVAAVTSVLSKHAGDAYVVAAAKAALRAIMPAASADSKAAMAAMLGDVLQMLTAAADPEVEVVGEDGGAEVEGAAGDGAVGGEVVAAAAAAAAVEG